MANNNDNKNKKQAIKPKGVNSKAQNSKGNINSKPLVKKTIKNGNGSRPTMSSSRPISYQGPTTGNKNLDKTEKAAKKKAAMKKKQGTNAKNKKKKPKSKARKVVKWIFLSFLFLFLAVGVATAGYIFAVIKTIPPLDIKSITSLSEPSTLYDKDEVFMDNLHSEVNRTVVTFDKIPQYLKDAYISIEDQRFYEHNGIDIKRILGSIYTDAKKLVTKQTGLHGGSTITQQLLKNTVLTEEDSIIERKIKEIYLALNLEEQLTKDQILLQYLNTIPLGGTTYGVEAASNYYFAKSVDKLNLIECAYIAGITQAPTYYMAYNPNNKDHPEVYINRTKTVLDKMLELGKITDKEYNTAVSDLDKGNLKFSQKTITYNLKYEWYINPAVNEVKKDLKEKYKYTDEEISKLLANGGLKIYTNMDRELQDYTQQVLNETKIYQENEPLIENSKTPAFQAAATVVDYKSGNVVAVVGGRGEHDAQSTNRAYTELRSVGSSTKPLTVYGPAINEKIMTAASTLDDAPIPEEIGSKYSNPAYNPSNDDKTYLGNIPLREGLRRSKNVCAVLVEDAIGIDTGMAYGQKVGLKYNEKNTGIATLALGQFYNDPANPDGGNPYVLASAFGVFGNEGIYTKPRMYSKVVDGTGKILLESEPEQTEIFSKQTAYIMYNLLQGSREYTGPNAMWGNIPVAGKTGTTTDSKDLWFSGVTPYYSGSVWLGYYNSSANLNALGLNSNSAANAWGKIMEKAHAGLEAKDIPEPSGLVKAEVCIDSGKIPTDLCRNDPRGSRTYYEYFIEGTEPTSLCDAHVKAQINTSNNKVATTNTPSSLITEKILVKKKYPNPATADYPYVFPLGLDDGDYSNFKDKEKEDEEKEKEDQENKETEEDEKEKIDIIDDILKQQTNITTFNKKAIKYGYVLTPGTTLYDIINI